MKLLAIILTFILTNTLFSQNCNNLGFEEGDFNNWEAWTGQAAGGFNAPTVPIMNSLGFSASRHQIVSAGTDFWSGISMVSPNGGAFSAQLGNSQPGGQAEQIRQTFLVTPNLTSYVYQYAVVLEDPGHVGRPLFQINIYDQNDSIIPCGEFLVRADQGISGFVSTQVMTVSGNHYIVYKDWTDVAVDLSAYLGDSITVEFTTADCNAGQHFGYAYIDGYCQTLEIDAVSQNCTNNYDLSAPDGYQSYQWSNGESGQNISVNNVNSGDSISVTLIPFMGCPTTIWYYFTAVNLPTAEFSSIDTCVNLATYFIDSSFANITSWNWSFGDGNTSINQNPTNVYLSGGAHDVTLIVTNNIGCSDTVIHTVNICVSGGTVEFDYPYSCGLYVDFSSLPSILNTDTIASYSWDFGDGTSSNLANPSHVYTSNGNYTVTLTLTLTSGQIISATHNISPYAYPSSSFTSSDTCINIPINFNDLSSGNIVSWNWNFGDGNTSTLQNPSNIYQSGGTYQVTLIVENDMGCTDTVINPVNICELGYPDFSYIIYCTDSVVFTDLSLGGLNDVVVSWSWDFGDGNFSSIQSPVHSYQSIGSFSVTLTVTFQSGYSASTTHQIIIPTGPIANFTANAPCFGQTTQFNDQSVQNIASWKWDLGDGTVSILQNPGHTYTNPQIYMVSLVVTDDNNCIDSISNNVVVHEIPSAIILGSETACDYLNAELSFLNNGDIISWSWDLGDGNVSVANPVNHLYDQVGSYDISLLIIDQNGCSNQITAPDFIQIYDSPVANFDFTPGELITDDTYVDFYNYSSIDAINWSWSFGDGGGSNDENPTYKYNEMGLYNIELIVENQDGCRDSISKVIQYKPDYQIFIPNAFTPDDDAFNQAFKAVGYGIKDFRMLIFNRWGEILFESHNINVGWSGIYMNNMVQDGVYVWKIDITTDADESVTKTGHLTVIR